jgi:type IV pilus assembly protein PilB
MLIQNSHLESLLLEKHSLKKQHVNELLSYAEKSQLTLRDVVIEKGILTKNQLEQMYAQTLNLPFVEVGKLAIADDVLHIIPERIAQKYKVIAFAQDDEAVHIGMVDPSFTKILPHIEKKTAKKVSVYVTTDEDLSTALQLYKKDLQKSVNELVERELSDTNIQVNDAPVIQITDLILKHAYREKASDVHIEPEEENVLVRFRIDSVLHDILQIDKKLHSSIVARIKVLSRLRTDEHLDAQDGKLKIHVDDENLDVRVSIIPTTEGEKVVMRLLSSKFRSFSLSDIGMSESDLKKVQDALSRSDGLILSTGPTGSGKTTSIYSLMKIINTRDKNITTIEDPVEYRIKGVNHIPVNNNTGFSFAKGLRSILRQDPDIIVVGEIRDPETANLAVNAALTGHLVLSTLHTNDAATALPRLIDMNSEPFLLASTVKIILAQRLVRKICTLCKEQVKATKEELRNSIPEKTWKRYFDKKTAITVYKGKGCIMCHQTGYSGRIGMFEILEISDSIRKLIMEKKDSRTIKEKAMKEGMTPLLDDGIQKVIAGITTLEEVSRVIKIDDVWEGLDS